MNWNMSRIADQQYAKETTALGVYHRGADISRSVIPMMTKCIKSLVADLVDLYPDVEISISDDARVIWQGCYPKS
jgi:hypothetical protein